MVRGTGMRGVIHIQDNEHPLADPKLGQNPEREGGAQKFEKLHKNPNALTTHVTHPT